MPERLNTVQEAMLRCRLGRTRFYEELNAGRIGSVRVGRRRLVPDSAIDRWIAERIAEGITDGTIRPEQLEPLAARRAESIDAGKAAV